MSVPRYALGIDLGTTNSSLAWAPLSDDAVASSEILAVEQLVAPGERAAEGQLPSFLYLPVEAELTGQAFGLPWDPERSYAMGHYARDRAAQAPGRVVSSGKSWLCHDGVDRRAAILPWGADEEIGKLSPVEVSARSLAHLREAWEHAHPDAPLAEQALVVTVPASFDAVARSLTEEAAREAGYGEHFTLLEEPQAAFYAWIGSLGSGWREQVSVGDLDLALAYRLKMKLEADGKKIDDWQLSAMTHACRAAKESLLADSSRDHFPISVPSRGRRLMAGTLSTELSREELNQTLLDGFFPQETMTARPQARQRTGLQNLGLPYASDAAISRHLAAFLARHQSVGQELGLSSGSLAHPSAVLFNGGVSKASPLRERLVSVLNAWMVEDGGQPMRVLDGDDPDLAVARGAVHFAQVRRGQGLRIRGGTARAYYVGIERAEMAVPGIPPRLDAVCVAPFGLEEGSEVDLPQELGLVVGERASFRFFASSSRRSDQAADKVDPQQEDIEELPPIETELDGLAGSVVPVRLHAQVTDVGTLALSALEQQSGKRHKLEFNIRVE